MSGMEEIPLDRYLFGEQQPCFGCSPTHETGFRLQFLRRGDEVLTRFTPGAQYQGPLGIMHGGLVTTLADEIAAWTLLTLKGRFGFTVEIQARLTNPVRIGRELVGRGRIEKDGTRILKVAVELHQDDKQCFRGLLTFAILDAAATQKMIGERLPDEWRKYTR